MPRYLIERRFNVSEDQMPVVGRKSRSLVENQFPEIVWEHSHVVVDESGAVSTYCVYAAPDEQMVRDHAQQLGAHEIGFIHEIAGDVTPADFPPVPA